MPRSTFVLCGLALLLSLPCLGARAQGGPTVVEVAPVETQHVSETVPIFAQITTSRDGSVASRFGGSVDSVHVLAGDRVESGDPLVELDRDLLEISLAQSEAQVAEAQAGIESARVQVDRTAKAFARIDALRGSSSFSQGRYDEAESDMLQARAALAQAEARLNTSNTQLAQARYELERSSIVAPFAGTVIAVNTIPGAFIQSGEAVVRLLDTSAFEVEAGVPARYISALSAGQEVEAKLDSGQSVTLTVRAVLPLEDPATRTRAVRFTGPGMATIGAAAVGESLTVEIAIGEARKVLAVPKDALIQAPEGWTVYVNADGTAEPRTVQIGVPLGNNYEVLSGLQNGDSVVVRGNERLRPGQNIAAGTPETN